MVESGKSKWALNAARAVAVAALTGACASEVAGAEPVDLVIYSPAPPTIMLDTHNRALGETLAACDAFGTVEVKAGALPEAIDQIQAVSADERPYHLPIMTTLDFQTAIDGTAPAWHAYDPPVDGLKFVTRLYDVSFGMLAFDTSISTPDDLRGKQIAVPARPSSVRWFTEALLGDGWGVLDEVTLVDIAPPDLPGAVGRGEIDATSWLIMSETPDGYLPLIPPLATAEGAHWLDVEAEALAAINTASPFSTALTNVSGLASGAPADASLLSFAQGLAAWEDTPDAVIRDIVTCMDGAKTGFGPGAYDRASQVDWPGLREADIHPAARAE